MHIRDLCTNKWQGILTQLGIDQRSLKNIHGPCPICGGKDRFRFDNKQGRGTFYCNSCGSGDGFDLAMKYTGLSFKDLARSLEGVVGQVKPVGFTRNEIDVRPYYTGMKNITSCDPVFKYLRNRGIVMVSGEGLRYHPNLKYSLGKAEAYPAMVALIQDEAGRALGYHSTFLTSEGRKATVPAVRKIRKIGESLSGGAIRLAPVSEHLAVTEGIENALAVMQYEKINCWSSVSAGLMQQIKLPKIVSKVSIFGDTDESFTGQEAAYALAKRLKREGREVEVIFKGGVGEDYLDFINKGAA